MATTCHLCSRDVTRSPHPCDPPEVAAFFHDRPRARELFQILWDHVRQWGDVEVAATKSRVSFVQRIRFLWVHEAGLHAIWIGFLHPSPLDSDRLRSGSKGNTWSHHTKITSRDDLDEELLRWMKESYQMQ